MLREARRPGNRHFVLVDSVVDGVGEGEGEGEVSAGTGNTCNWTKARALVDRGEIVVDPTMSLLPKLVRLILKVPRHPKHHTSHSRSSSRAVSRPPTYAPLSMPCVHGRWIVLRVLNVSVPEMVRVRLGKISAWSISFFVPFEVMFVLKATKTKTKTKDSSVIYNPGCGSSITSLLTESVSGPRPDLAKLYHRSLRMLPF
jgi:hypothetical protein